MKKILIMLALLFGLNNYQAVAQVEEATQLALDIEKLAQLKEILTQLKKAYDILFGGYTLIKNISEGNFNLHQAFLDGLLEVSPAVKKYKRIADIVSLQGRLIKEYKAALSRFRQNSWFTPGELDYIGSVYNRLFNKSLDDLEALLNVVTARRLRMSDDERIKEIDRIFDVMQEKMVFLRQFNSSTSVLAIQRQREGNDIDVQRKLNDIK